MYQTSNAYKIAVKSNVRYMKAYFEYNKEIYYPDAAKLNDDIYTDDTFIGTFISKQGNLKLQAENGSLDLENEWIKLYMGVILEDETIEYVPMGSYLCYERNDLEYKICDKRILFNQTIDTKKLDFPCTVNELLKLACKEVGIEYTDNDYPNKDYLITDEVFFGYDAMWCDVVLAVTGVAGSWAKITRNDKLKIRYIESTDCVIEPKNYFGNIAPNQKYGPINTVVLSRDPQSDNVYYPENLPTQINELKIINNPIADLDNTIEDTRYTTIVAIYNQVKGLSYTPVTIEFQGDPSIDSGDVIKVTDINGTAYQTIVLKHTLDFTGGLRSIIEAPALSKSQIDYAGASSTKSLIAKTELKVDKVKNEITGIVEEIEGNSEKVAALTININEISTSINSLSESVYKFETGSHNIFSNCNQGIEAVDNETYSNDMPLDIEKDYLRAKDICISVQIDFVNAIVGSGYAGATFDVGYANGTKKTYSCFLYAGEQLLEYILEEGITNTSKRFYTTYTIEDKEVTSVSNLKIIITAKGEKITVSRPKVEFGIYPTGFDYDLQFIRDNITIIQDKYSTITQDIGSIKLSVGEVTKSVETIGSDLSKNYSSLTTIINTKESEIKQYADEIVLGVKQTNEETYATKKELTTTKTDLNSVITLSATEIKSEVSKTYATIDALTGKVDSKTIISTINQSAETVAISANKLDFKGKEFNLTTDEMTINSTYFSVDKEGNLTAKSAIITGGNLTTKTEDGRYFEVIGSSIRGIDNTGTRRIWLYHTASQASLILMGSTATSSVSSNFAQFGGNVSVTGTVTQSSDESLKENIMSLSDELINVGLELESKSYNLKNREISDKVELGYVAQNVIKAFDKHNLNYKDYGIVNENDKGILSLNYNAIAIITHAIVKQLHGRVTELERKVNA